MRPAPGALFARSYPAQPLTLRPSEHGGLRVADVFVSFSQIDHARVRPIAERLASLGYTVWWEHQTALGQAFVDECERQLDASRVVLAIWTHNSRNSTLMFAQAARALDGEKLVQLRLDVMAPPPPFDALPVSDISSERPEWGPLEDALQRLARAGEAPAPLVPVKSPGLLAAAAPIGAPKVLMLATLLTLGVFFTALSAAYTGAMNPEQMQFVLTGMIGVGGVCAVLAGYRMLIVRRAGG